MVAGRISGSRGLMPRTLISGRGTLMRSAACIFVAVLIFVGAVSAAGAAGKTVGVIMTGNIPYYKDVHKSFIDTLTAEGFGPGTVEVILQTPSPDAMSWTNAARKVIASGADIIVCYGAPATLAVLRETSDVPVVFAGVYDPHAAGATGGNTTGVSSKVPVASLIRNLKSITNFSSLGVVFNDAEKDTTLQANEVKQLEGTFGFRSSRFNVKRAEDVAKIANVDALFLTTGCAAMHCVSNILGSAHKAKIPTVATIGGGESGGVILTITANPQEQGRVAAQLAGKVLKGAKPSSLPVEQPKKVDMTINVREATELGLKVPFDLLSSATRVIK
jgi:putative ABC transport system substrate-binding protein